MPKHKRFINENQMKKEFHVTLTFQSFLLVILIHDFCLLREFPISVYSLSFRTGM